MFDALQSELSIFKFQKLKSKILKIPEFNLVIKFEPHLRIIWDNSTQKVRDQSWCQDAGLLPRKGENVEVKIFSKRSKAWKFYHKKTEPESNNPNERDTTIQTMASQHVQRLISSSRSGKPFNKKLSMMTDCEFCPRRYASRAALRAHEKRDHMDPNEIWLCLFCPKTYICKSDLTVALFTRATRSKDFFDIFECVKTQLLNEIIKHAMNCEVI